MKTLFKIIATLVLLLVIAIIAIPMFVDPNDYKGEIASAVEEQTGRKLSIEGDLKLSLFPWLGVKIGKVSLGNAQGFETPIFAAIDGVDVHVKLMPLLSQQLEMDTLSLHGLRVNLARNEQGVGNWEDLAGPAGAEPPPPTDSAAGGPPSVAALAIGGLDIQDANIDWLDKQNHQHFSVSDLSMETGAVVFGKPVDLELKFHVAGDNPEMQGDIELKGRLEAANKGQLIRLQGLELTTDLSGKGLPAPKIDLTMNSDVSVDLEKQQLSIPNLDLKSLGVAVNGELSADQILGDPTYRAKVALPDFDLKALLVRLGQPPIETTDPNVLKKVGLNAAISGTKTSANLESLTARLDDTTLKGSVNLPAFEGPVVRFKLDVDAIDADRYLPPPAEGDPAAAGDPAEPAPKAPPTPGAAVAGAASEGGVPLEPLRKLDVDGSFTIGKLKVANLNVAEIALKLKGKKGLIKLDPISAKLYQGGYKGHIHLDARGEQPRIAFKESLSGVQAEPLLTDLTGKGMISGTAQVDGDVKMVGAEPDAIKKSLNGLVKFSFQDGAVNGVNIGQMIRSATARFKGQSAPADAPLKTDFTELLGSVKLTNGLADNPDLSVKSPLLRIDGKGTADLISEKIDYLLTTTIVGSLEGQGGQELADLKGLPIPIRVGGTFQEPSYKPDVGKLLEGKAKQEVQKQVDKVKEKAKGQIQEKAGEKLKGLIKGLF